MHGKIARRVGFSFVAPSLAPGSECGVQTQQDYDVQCQPSNATAPRRSVAGLPGIARR